MLLQSHTGVIRVFPAVPENWKNVSFNNLRAMGGFLVSAALKDGKVVRLEIYAEKGGRLAVFSPFEHKVVEYDTQPGSRIDLAVE